MVAVGRFDGSSKGNPGPSHIGYVIFSDETEKNEITRYSKSIEDGTNNEAEYKALLLLTQRIWKLGIEKIIIKGDSKLIINHVNGQWKCKAEHLKSLLSQVKRMLNNIPNWKLVWEPREKNAIANRLADGK
jgi:ribonuclease HI